MREWVEDILQRKEITDIIGNRIVCKSLTIKEHPDPSSMNTFGLEYDHFSFFAAEIAQKRILLMRRTKESWQVLILRRTRISYVSFVCVPRLCSMLGMNQKHRFLIYEGKLLIFLFFYRSRRFSFIEIFSMERMKISKTGVGCQEKIDSYGKSINDPRWPLDLVGSFEKNSLIVEIEKPSWHHPVHVELKKFHLPIKRTLTRIE